MGICVLTTCICQNVPFHNLTDKLLKVALNDKFTTALSSHVFIHPVQNCIHEKPKKWELVGSYMMYCGIIC